MDRDPAVVEVERSIDIFAPYLQIIVKSVAVFFHSQLLICLPYYPVLTERNTRNFFFSFKIISQIL